MTPAQIVSLNSDCRGTALSFTVTFSQSLGKAREYQPNCLLRRVYDARLSGFANLISLAF